MQGKGNILSIRSISLYLHLHVVKAKPRAVIRADAQKYVVTNIKIALIYFENFF